MNKLYICGYAYENRYLLTLISGNNLELYADEFELDEEKDLLSFYKTPFGNDTGKELIAAFNWRYIIGLSVEPNTEVKYDSR